MSELIRLFCNQKAISPAVSYAFLHYDDPEEDSGLIPEMDFEAVAETIERCADDIRTLWSHPSIQALLTRRAVRPEENPGL